MMNHIPWAEIRLKIKTFAKEAFKKYALFILHLSPHQSLAQAVFFYTLLGWVALSLPFMTSGDVSLLDNLFTAASAASTTGLVSVNFAESYTFLGKLVTLALIQAGGIGYMTFSSFLYLSVSQHLKHRHREILSAEFSLPQTLHLKDFLRATIIFTAIVESIGAVLLFNYFRHHHYGVFDAVWFGVFHSVSAFCTAGFSLWTDGMVQFADSKTMNTVISALALSGAMGFIVVTDIFNWIRRKAKTISYTTKVIVLTTFAFLAWGTATVWITSPGITVAESFFQSMSAMTTVGFNTVSVSSLSSCSLLILVLLMSVGASPSGTGGGIKTTAVASLLAMMYSRLRGHTRITLLGARIPFTRLYMAGSTFIFYITLLFSSLFLLTWTERLPFIKLLFEAAAALGTAGLSTGITGDLSGWGKLIVIVTMLIGRIGVITFGMALLAHDDDDEEEFQPPIKKEDLAV